MVGLGGLRVDRIERVVVGDEEPADPAELVVGVEQIAVLIEDLEAVVAAVGDEEPALGIECQRVRSTELARTEPDDAPLLDEVALGIELQDAPGPPFGWIRTLAAVTVGHEDVTVRGGDDVARLVELAGPAAGLSGGSETHQHFALGAELDHLVSLGSGLVALGIGDPNVPLVVDVKSVGEHEESGAELGEDFAGVTIELQNRIHCGVLLATAGQRVRSASVIDPDVAVGSYVHTGGGTPAAAVREIRPLGDDNRVRIRQVPLDEIRVPGRLFHFGGHLAATAKDGERQAAR